MELTLPQLYAVQEVADSFERSNRSEQHPIVARIIAGLRLVYRRGLAHADADELLFQLMIESESSDVETCIRARKVLEQLVAGEVP